MKLKKEPSIPDYCAGELQRMLDEHRAVEFVPCPVCHAPQRQRCEGSPPDLLFPSLTHPARVLLSKLIPGDVSFFDMAKSDLKRLPTVSPYPKR